MNFKEYWKNNEAIYTRLGVTKEVAYKIWCDAADAAEKVVTAYFLSKI